MSKPATMHKVQSTNISEMGSHQGTLFVRFNGGKLYKYPGAGHHLQEGLERAKAAEGEGETVGKWFHRAIKGSYNHALVDD